MNNHSPIPEEVTEAQLVNEMTFTEAIEAIVEGKKVTRLEWNNDHNCYLDSKLEQLLIARDGKVFQWIINKGDLLAEDWVIV